MAWVIRGATSDSSSSQTVNIWVSMPSGVVDGDILLGVVCANVPAGTPTLGAPEGWSLVDQDPGGTKRTAVFARVAASESTESRKFTSSVVGDMAGVILAVAGGDPATPIDVTASGVDSGNTSSHAIPAVTPTYAEELLVGVLGNDSGTSVSSHSWPTGWTEQADVYGTASITVGTKVQATRQSEGVTVSSGVSYTAWKALIALRIPVTMVAHSATGLTLTGSAGKAVAATTSRTGGGALAATTARRLGPALSRSYALGASTSRSTVATVGLTVATRLFGGGRIVPAEAPWGRLAVSAVAGPTTDLLLEVRDMRALYPGDTVRVTAYFRDQKGRMIDPQEVRFRTRGPGGETAVVSYGTNAEVVRVRNGVYALELDVDRAGDWYARVESDEAASEVRIPVSGTAF